MTTIRMANFGGIIPKVGARLLPDNCARVALNTKMLAGELAPWWAPNLVGADTDYAALALGTLGGMCALPMQDGTQKVYLFENAVEAAMPPLINLSTERFYYTGADFVGVRVAELSAWPDPVGDRAGAPAFTATPTGSATGGASDTTETRVYVICWVSNYGEVGPPSPTLSLTGKLDATWDFDVTPNDGDVTDFNITEYKIFRTFTSATGVDYRELHTGTYVPATPISFTDNIALTDVAVAPVLEAFSHYPAPDELRGLVDMGNGIMAGYKGNTVYLSEAYRPYAWPPEYQISVGQPIVAIAAIGSSLVVLTGSNPIVISGTHPAAVSMTKVENNYSCASAQSVVSFAGQVIYPSRLGLVLVTEGGFQLITESYAGYDEWFNTLQGASMTFAARHQSRYIGFGPTSMVFDPMRREAGLSLFSLASTGWEIRCACNGVNGELFLGVGTAPNFFVMEWEGAAFAESLVYTWRSKSFIVPKPCNFGALQIRGAWTDTYVASGDVFSSPGPLGWAINDGEHDDFPLIDWLPTPPPGGAFGAINGPSEELFGNPADYPALGYSINGPVYPDINDFTVPDGVYVTVKLYGDGVLRWTGYVSSADPVRLPSGYKATEWELEVTGAVKLSTIVLASTIKELEQVP